MRNAGLSWRVQYERRFRALDVETPKPSRPRSTWAKRKRSTSNNGASEKGNANARSEANLKRLAEARKKIDYSKNGRRKNQPDGVRGKRAVRRYHAVLAECRKVVEKAFGSLAEQYVADGKVDKAILGNAMLMEAAVIILARHPEDDPEEHLRGQPYHTLDARFKAMALIAPYVLEKPEQKVSATVDTVESLILKMAEEDDENVIDVTPHMEALPA